MNKNHDIHMALNRKIAEAGVPQTDSAINEALEKAADALATRERHNPLIEKGAEPG